MSRLRELLLSVLGFYAQGLAAFPSRQHAENPVGKHTAQEVIAQLNLTANIEKGYYIQTFEDPHTWRQPLCQHRNLLPLRGPAMKKVLGPDVFDGQHPQVVINSWLWQSAQSTGDWTLVGTTVAPGFVESGYEVAAPDWVPSGV
ncbi:RmlC-like cupin domain-containing protein [Xylariales sp. PMI_506]|nr:RmlC-like cupin domain-containing protein [Xylariales sp. PMI_506]